MDEIIANNELYNRLGYCRLVDHLGNDWTPVKAARQSYGDTGLKGEAKDTRLLTYLLKNKHSSPFEQASITWEIKMPIFVMRQFVRHRTFRLNEMSARYTEMADDFYIPLKWRVQHATNKQGSAASDDLDHETISKEVEEHCKSSYKLYESLLERGVAKEQARIVLPVNLMTAISVNIDLNNLMKFFVLRLHEHAQEEIRLLAQEMYFQAKVKFPAVMDIFTKEVLSKTEGIVVPAV